jgi:hypothetical protein
MNPGDITYRKDKEIPGDFWHFYMPDGKVLRFTFIASGRFLYSRPGEEVYSIRLIQGKRSNNPHLHRRKIIKSIFKAVTFERHTQF